MDVRKFPSKVIDISGAEVDVVKLSQKFQVILITLKATWCPICPPLLKTINRYGLNRTASFSDPYGLVLEPPSVDLEFYQHLLKVDCYFIILAPGNLETLKSIQVECSFEGYPFVMDDPKLTLAKQLSLQHREGEIWPAIFTVEPNLTVNHIHFGRAPRFYGISLLVRYLKQEREKYENLALDVLVQTDTALTLVSSLIVKLGNCAPSCTLSLNLEIWLESFNYLDIKQILKWARVSQEFKVVCLLACKRKLLKGYYSLLRCMPTFNKQLVDEHMLHRFYRRVEDPDQFNQLQILGEEDRLHRPQVSLTVLKRRLFWLRDCTTMFMKAGARSACPTSLVV